MTSKERIEAILDGKLPDFIPIFPKISYSNTISCKDMCVLDYMTKPKEMARACITAYRKFGWDGVSLHTDIGSEGMALGSIYERPKNNTSILKEYLLNDISEYGKIILPDPYNVEPMKTVIEATKIVKKTIGNEAYILAWTNAPLNIASQVLKLDELLMELILNPEEVHKLLSKCLDVAIEYGSALIDSGADAIAFGHALASSTVISRTHYEEFALPYEKKLVAALHNKGAKVFTHICGNIEPIIDLISQNGSDVIDFDYICKIENLLNRSNKIFRGNIDPAVLAFGTEKIICDKINELFSKSKNSNRLILGTGCEVSLNTPEMNLINLVKYARELGKLQ